MSTFEQVYQSWIDETIADAKNYVNILNKEDLKLRTKKTVATRNKGLAAVRNNFTSNLEGKLNLGLSV